MKTRSLRYLLRSFIVILLILEMAACSPALTPTSTATQTLVPSNPTEVPPTLTPEPSTTPRREINVALKKPVRVSASWVVDPPERAVDGNFGNWWGAGGPAPQWIEVDLQGLYSISRIKVVSQGPTGQAVYQVMGRGMGSENQLLHTFDGIKKENQTLEFSPETPWEDIATIRIEILNGSGWVGFREVQVFSRDDSKPLPTAAEAPPSFLAGVQLDALAPITPENAILMEQLAMLGRGSINELAWSLDGKIVAGAGTLGVWLYDATDRDEAPRLLEGHTRDVLSVAFCADGDIVFSASQDGRVKQWNTATGALKRTISMWDDFSYEVGSQKREAEVWSVAFSPDRTLLAAGSLDGSLRLWNVLNGKQRTVLVGHKRQIGNLEFSPDGKLLASSSLDNVILIWDVETGKQIASLTGEGQVQSLVFSPDSQLLAYGGTGMTTRVWDTVTGEERAELPEHTGVISLAFDPEGASLISSSLSGSLWVWDVQSGSSRIFSERAGWIMNMAYSPDGARLATYAWDGMLRLWETTSGSITEVLATHTSPVNSIAFSPDNTILAAGGEDGSVRLWNVATNSLQSTLWGNVLRVTSVAFSPDGRLLVSGSFDKTVILWDVASASRMKTLTGHESYVRSVAFSPDGSLVASSSTDKTIRLWDVATGEARAILIGHTGEVQSVAFSSDGKWLLSASVDDKVRIWDIASAKEIGLLQDHLGYVNDAAFSPDGMKVASGSGDHRLCLWDLSVTLGVVTSKGCSPQVGHGGWVLSVAFSPDGKIISSANVSTTSYWVAPGEIHLYSAETAFPYNLLRGHTKRVNSIAFSPDGKLLASGSADGSVRLWGVEK